MYEKTYSIVLNNELLDSLRCDYPVDGFVCYKDDDLLCAYKYDNEFAEPVVKYVESITQPTTKIYPRIWIEETEISDCKVNKVTGKSGEAIINGQIGPGAKIEIVRSGEVVPNWTGNVIKSSDDVWEPECSYGCDKSFVKIDGANFYCTNPKCPSILDGVAEKLIRHFAPKGFTTEMVEQMFQYFKSDDCVLDTLLLELMDEDRIEYPTLGDTEYQNKMINETMNNMKSCKMSLYDLVSICSIEAFGKTLSKDLENYISSQVTIRFKNGVGILNQYLKTQKDFNVEQVNNSKARKSWYNRHNILCQIMNVFDIVFFNPQDINNKGTVCITGKLDSGITKKEFANIIEKKGYTWVDKVNKDLTILICNKIDSGKAKKAEKYGVKIVTEKDFINNY